MIVICCVYKHFVLSPSFGPQPNDTSQSFARHVIVQIPIETGHGRLEVGQSNQGRDHYIRIHQLPISFVCTAEVLPTFLVTVGFLFCLGLCMVVLVYNYYILTC